MNFTTTKKWGDKLFRIIVDDDGVRVTEVNVDLTPKDDDTVREVWIDPFKMKNGEDCNALQVHIYVANSDPEGAPMTLNVFPDNVAPSV